MRNLSKDASKMVGIGIILMILGFLSILVPAVAGASVALLVGVFILIGGAAQAWNAWKASDGWAVFLGVLFAILGLMMLITPLRTLVGLTLLLAIFFFTAGVFKIVWAFQSRDVKGWGWMLASGVVTLLLGVMILNQWPASSRWAIGLLVGIELLMNGWMLIAVGGAVKGAAADVKQAVANVKERLAEEGASPDA